MAHPNLEEIHQVAQAAVKAGRQVLLHYFGRLAKVEEKHMAGLVSEADLESEKAIGEVLASFGSGISILGEEQSYLENLDLAGAAPGRRWILDPLDGTTNYIHKFFAYSISLGLEWDGEMIYGIVDLPALNMTYHGLKGKGAFKTDASGTQRIQVSQRPNLNSSLVATGFSVSNSKVLDEQVRAFAKIIHQVRGVRRAGSAAIDLCLVAEGVYDAYWERNLQAWDTAAGALLVKEAGGVVTDFKNVPYNPFQNSILASNQLIHSELLGNLQ